MGACTGEIILMFCACMFGFFCTPMGNAGAEAGCLITGSEFFHFTYGYMELMMAVGWVVGPPSAGMLQDG